MAPSVALCMIVKNEEANLPACLGSAADLVQEIIVVDTGSTDRTRESAARFGARVIDFAWVDSFAAARNESLRHATRDWVFWLDADDRLDEANRARLRSLFTALPEANVAYLMQCLSPQPAGGAGLSVDHARLFRNHPQIRWRYRVHEQIIPAVEQLGGRLQTTDVVIHHVGYQDPVLRLQKNQRNLRLLELDRVDHPDDPIVLYHLGWALVDLGRPGEAVPWLRQSLARSWPGLSCIRGAYAMLVNALYGLGQQREALSTCLTARTAFPNDGELLFMEGVLRTLQGDPAGGEGCLKRLLELESSGAALAARSARGYSAQARQHLADLYLEQGRAAEAEAQWRAVLAEVPDDPKAWLGLVELWRTQGQLDRLSEAEQAAQRLQAVPRHRVDALVLRALVLRARREYSAARQALGEAIALAPQALEPRQVLSFVILEEGRDWAAFEKALRDILRIAPVNAQARHNLAVLLQQQGRPPENG